MHFMLFRETRSKHIRYVGFFANEKRLRLAVANMRNLDNQHRISIHGFRASCYEKCLQYMCTGTMGQNA